MPLEKKTRERFYDRPTSTDRIKSNGEQPSRKTKMDLTLGNENEHENEHENNNMEFADSLKGLDKYIRPCTLETKKAYKCSFCKGWNHNCTTCRGKINEEKIHAEDLKEGIYIIGSCPFFALDHLRNVQDGIVEDYEYTPLPDETEYSSEWQSLGKKKMGAIKLRTDSFGFNEENYFEIDAELPFVHTFCVDRYPKVQKETPIPTSCKFDKMVCAIKSTVTFMNDECKFALSLIKQCKNKGKNKVCLFQQVVPPEYEGIELAITLSNVKDQLLGKDWFNGDLINDWGKMMNSVFFDKVQDRTLVVNAQLYTKLMYDNIYCFSNVERWIKKKDMLDNNLKQVIIPINRGNVHWLLSVVKIQEKEVWLIDSSVNTDPQKYFCNILKCWSDFCLLHLDEILNPEEWKFIHKASTYQNDGNSCGTFVCSNMYMVAYNTRNFKYPVKWPLIFKSFMLYCFTRPYLFEYSDFCPTCLKWRIPNEVCCNNMSNNMNINIV